MQYETWSCWGNGFSFHYVLAIRWADIVFFILWIENHNANSDDPCSGKILASHRTKVVTASCPSDALRKPPDLCTFRSKLKNSLK